MQAGMYKPYFYRHKKDEEPDDQQDESKVEKDDDQSEIIGRFRSYYPVKLWPNQETYDLWSNYLNLECIMKDYQSLNTLYLCVRTFENAVIMHIKIASEKQDKKQELKQNRKKAIIEEEKAQIIELKNQQLSRVGRHTNFVNYSEQERS